MVQTSLRPRPPLQVEAAPAAVATRSNEVPTSLETLTTCCGTIAPMTFPSEIASPRARKNGNGSCSGARNNFCWSQGEDISKRTNLNWTSHRPATAKVTPSGIETRAAWTNLPPPRSSSHPLSPPQQSIVPTAAVHPVSTSNTSNCGQIKLSSSFY